MNFLKITAYFQGVYFLLTALWPIIDVNSFMLVTGYKEDIWLLKTVSVLILSIAITIITACYRKEINFSIFILAISSAAFLAFIDFYYSCNEVISKIYLVDAFVEILLIASWLRNYFHKQGRFR
jgi:hypothetical protein